VDCVFILGLPKAIRARIEGAAKKEGIRISSVLSDIGKKGSLQLLPDPSDAVHSLKAYYDQFSENYENAFVVVLPYAPIPVDVDGELLVLEEFGAEIVYISEGQDGWPVLAKKTRPDTRFLNEVFQQLMLEILGEEDVLPSDYFRSVAEKNPNFLIIKGALDTCDQVAEHRREFLKMAADALSKFIDKGGRVGRIDAFFGTMGLDHAQTGGINTTLSVFKEGRRIYHKSSNTHLKQGDNTTPQAAARIYYHEFSLEERCYVAVLYAGPHPETDICRQHELISV